MSHAHYTWYACGVGAGALVMPHLLVCMWGGVGAGALIMLQPLPSA